MNVYRSNGAQSTRHSDGAAALVASPRAAWRPEHDRDPPGCAPCGDPVVCRGDITRQPGERRVRRGSCVLVCAVLSGSTVTGAAGQVCFGLPLRRGELWLSAAGSRGPETPLYEVGASFNAANKVLAQLAMGSGGYDVPGGGSLAAVGLAGMAAVGPVAVCAWGRIGTLEYSFRNRFGMFRGEVEHRVAVLGLEVGGRVLERGSSWLGWNVAAGVANHRERVSGRRLVLDDPPTVYEQGTRSVDYAWPLVVDFGITVRAGPVGTRVHMIDRAAFSDGLVLRAEVGLAGIRLVD